MKADYFISKDAGRCYQMPGGYPAFHPAPLPPKLLIDWALANLLSESDRALSNLSQAGQLLPNPRLLIRPYLWREAILSSRIENTIADIKDLALLDGQKESHQPEEHSAAREVLNYVEAIQTGLDRLGTLAICSRLICELHAILLKGTRGGQQSMTTGEYRRTQNWIGPPGATLTEATYVPPPPDEMHRALSAWENYLNTQGDEPVLIKTALMHYQFEAIHPFLDGNGRIGRLLITLFLCERGCLSQPLLDLSGLFDQTRDDYYRLLLAVSARGHWREWIEYFLRGIRQQATSSLGRTQRILSLYQGYQARLKATKRPPQSARFILDEVFGNPFFSISRYRTRTNQAFNNVAKGVQFWIKEGLLVEKTGQRRNRQYVAAEMLNELSESIPIRATVSISARVIPRLVASTTD